jgi:WbqC-like protein family
MQGAGGSADVIAAIMQPYFFPYIGYFQLMRAVDIFVFHDDVQYIKAGWVNRNRILLNGEASWLTLPVRKDASSLAINQRHYTLDADTVDSTQQRLRGCYSKAPEYAETFPFLCELLAYPNSNVAAFNSSLLIALARKLGIRCEFTSASEIDVPVDSKSQDKVIELCRRIGADRYINPIGGLALYDGAAFAGAGIDLSFLQAKPTHYAQFGATHLPFLSIIDVLMFNPTAQVQTMLGDFQLVRREPASIQ